MTDSDHGLDPVARAANDLVPQLAERLARYRLGELEVSDGDLRLRIRGGGIPSRAGDGEGRAVAARPPSRDEPVPNADEVTAAVPVGSPAVGFFVYADGLGPGLEVQSGDSIGHVEMLGVRHEVRVPRAGVVRSLVAESGEAVEYGQVVVELEPGEAGR